MRDLPISKLDPKVKNVWRISDAIGIIIAFVVCFIPCLIVFAVVPDELWALGLMLGVFVLFALLLVLCVLILPPIRYVRWRYQLSDEFLDIAKGIIWKQRTIVPFIRVQNTDTKQGPIMRAFGLASVTVATAAGEHEIPGLSVAEAEVLRDRAAELARIAREDV